MQTASHATELSGEPSARPTTDAGQSTTATASSEAGLPRELAESLCFGFKYHDGGDREACLEAFYAVDRHQFAHLDDEEARRAAAAYVDALWAKDELEAAHTTDGQLDRQALGDADWSSVREPLERRAAAAGIDPSYATLTAEGWRNHKAGADYWTPMGRARVLELRAALDDQTYPEKPSDGRSGFGPLATRYLLGVELHDMHTPDHWEEAIDVMVPYYAGILEAHR